MRIRNGMEFIDTERQAKLTTDGYSNGLWSCIVESFDEDEGYSITGRLNMSGWELERLILLSDDMAEEV